MTAADAGFRFLSKEGLKDREWYLHKGMSTISWEIAR